MIVQNGKITYNGKLVVDLKKKTEVVSVLKQKNKNQILLVWIEKPENLYCIKNKIIPENCQKPDLSLLLSLRTIEPLHASICENAQKITVEKFAGYSLKQFFIKNNLQISNFLLANISLNLLEILQNFHQKGLVHGRLKPSNIIITNDNYKPKVSLINVDNVYYINKIDKKTDVLVEKPEKKNIDIICSNMPIKPNKFSSVQILKKDRIDYKADLESLFFILYYLTNNGKTICNSLAEKKLLIDQINLSIYKERLIEKLSSPLYYFLLHISSLKFKVLPNYDYLFKILRGPMSKDDFLKEDSITSLNNSSLSTTVRKIQNIGLELIPEEEMESSKSNIMEMENSFNNLTKNENNQNRSNSNSSTIEEEDLADVINDDDGEIPIFNQNLNYFWK